VKIPSRMPLARNSWESTRRPSSLSFPGCI
jgi:hypothetical protein